MTCCIVAALIISQILAYRDRIRRLLGLRVDADAGHDPLLTPELRQRMGRAIIPALALSATLALGYQHRHHLAAAVTQATLSADAPITAPICRATAPARHLAQH
jgi:hypothetical protein